MTETQERFLRHVAARVPLDRVVEVHLFPPIRQGGVETGIAVIAATEGDAGEAAPDAGDDGVNAEVAPPEAVEAAGPPDAPAEPGDRVDEGPSGDVPGARPRHPEPRHTVFSARYRLTLKGADRGKWECDVVAEAEAPLVTVDAVVRGVRKRSGEQSDAERVSGDALRQLAPQPA